MPDTPSEPDDEPPAARDDQRAGPEATATDSSAEAGGSTAPTTGAAEADDATRRWLIRFLVGLGIGIPILIEGATLLRMVRSFLFGGDGGGGGNESDDGGDTDPTVDIGDEILTATPQPETLRRAVVISGESVWEFEATIRVENTGNEPYTFRVDAMTTDAGNRIADPASTEQLAPGETATIEHTWRMPAGERPGTFEVVGIVETAAGEDLTERTVELGEFPIQN